MDPVEIVRLSAPSSIKYWTVPPRLDLSHSVCQVNSALFWPFARLISPVNNRRGVAQRSADLQTERDAAAAQHRYGTSDHCVINRITTAERRAKEGVDVNIGEHRGHCGLAGEHGQELIGDVSRGGTALSPRAKRFGV